jgi:hypothetical protein
MQRLPDAAAVEPLVHVQVVWAEAVVLVDHEAQPIAHLADELLGLSDGGRHGLLQHDMHAALRGDAGERSMGADRRGDVHRIGLLLIQHTGEVGVYPGHAELLCPGLGALDQRIADGYHLHSVRLFPAGQVEQANCTGAGEGDAQAPLTQRSGCWHRFFPLLWCAGIASVATQLSTQRLQG